jgi:hypothetical protein
MERKNMTLLDDLSLEQLGPGSSIMAWESSVIEKLQQEIERLKATNQKLVREKVDFIVQTTDANENAKALRKKITESTNLRSAREKKYQEEIKRQQVSMTCMFSDLKKSKSEVKELKKKLSEAKKEAGSRNESADKSTEEPLSQEMHLMRSEERGQISNRWGFRRRSAIAAPLSPNARKLRSLLNENMALKERLFHIQALHKEELKERREEIMVFNTPETTYEEDSIDIDTENENDLPAEDEERLEERIPTQLFSSVDASAMSRIDYLKLKRRHMEQVFQSSPAKRK